MLNFMTEESLLVLRGLGIQTSSSSSTYLSTSVTRFIPTTAIQDIFIHEAFKGFEVRFYLAIVVEEEEDVVVVFPVRPHIFHLVVFRDITSTILLRSVAITNPALTDGPYAESPSKTTDSRRSVAWGEGMPV